MRHRDRLPRCDQLLDFLQFTFGRADKPDGDEFRFGDDLELRCSRCRVDRREGQVQHPGSLPGPGGRGAQSDPAAGPLRQESENCGPGADFFSVLLEERPGEPDHREQSLGRSCGRDEALVRHDDHLLHEDRFQHSLLGDELHLLRNPPGVQCEPPKTIGLR